MEIEREMDRESKKEMIQVVFGVKVKDEVPGEVTKIGRLDMEWKTRMGERGRLQTSHLERMVPGRGELILKVRIMR